jgi:hypothetical protein
VAIASVSSGGHSDAAPALEPQRHVGDQRPEGGRAAEPADQQRLRRQELPQGGRLRRRDVADRHHHPGQDHRHGDAETVGQTAHQHAAGGEADHGGGVGQRGVAAADPELGLDRRQRDHHRPQADAADRAERERGGQPQPGLAAVEQRRGHGSNSGTRDG